MARRTNAQRALVQGTAANVASLPAPVGGWNARDSLANMEATDAVTLENWFPSVSSVNLRGGYSQFATGLPGQVETLMTYSSGSSNKLFAIANGSIYNVTAGGAVGSADVTGLTNSRWEYVNITTAGGSYLMAVNGVDSAKLYNGTTWSTPSITGVSSADFDNVTLFKNRLWFVQHNSLKAWYLPVNSIGGAAEAFDLTSVAKLGGSITSFGAWTIDAGYGVDDNLVFVTSNGEIIVYRGTDPSSASTWALIGIWQLGAPVGHRCTLKWGGDILVLSLDGLLPLAQALQSSRLDPRVALSDKIQGAITEVTSTYKNNFGWQILYYAKRNALFINVPIAVGQQQQFVMNTITKAWCNFTGWTSNCWTIFNDEPYFGGNGYVGLAWDDNYVDNTSNITANALQAFNYYGSRGVKKYFTRARPSLFTDGVPSTFVGMNVDFQIADTTAALSFAPNPYALWDTAQWDSGIWGSGLTITNNWQGITGIGYCGATQLKTSSSGIQVEWASTDVVYQTGWAGI